MIFGILGAVSIFLPLADVTPSNVWIRVLIIVAIALLIAIIAVIRTCQMVKSNSKCLYSKGPTRVIFEYSDMRNVIETAISTGDETTIVVPINTDLKNDFNKDYIHEHGKNTIHDICLQYIYEKSDLTENKPLFELTQIKKDGFDENGKIGDWFLLQTKSIGIKDGNLQFMFIEFYDIEKIDGKPQNSALSKEQFTVTLQSLVSAISHVLPHESKIYIPLIGAGAGNVGKSKDIMHFVKAMLRFNKKDLRQEIHVVVNKKYRDETPIYQLSEF